VLGQTYPNRRYLLAATSIGQIGGHRSLGAELQHDRARHDPAARLDNMLNLLIY
jgi:hypothetical protein